MHDIVAASDMHIGTEYCNYTKVMSFLTHVKTKKLILVGDILDVTEGDISSLKSQLCFKLIVEIAHKTTVIWIAGNHEGGYYNLYNLCKFTNIICLPEKYFDAKTCTLFTHGHLQFRNKSNWFEEFVYKTTREIAYRIKNLFGWNIIPFVQKLPIISKLIKAFESNMLGVLKQHKSAETICTGHFHTPKIDTNYMNCGDFTFSCTYLAHDSKAWSLHKA